MSREFANLSPDEIKAEIKKREEKGEDLDSGARGESRDSFGAELLGSLSDIGNMITGKSRGGNQAGYIDEAGNYKQRTCFTKGTPVSTSTEKKPVESIKDGDIVFAKDEKTGRIVPSKVQQTYVRTTDRIYKLEYEDGTVIETTATHPFFIAGDSDTSTDSTGSPTTGSVSDISSLQAGKWIEAKDLQIGDESILQDGRLTQIQSIEQVHVAPTKVYNIEMEDFHTYFVGEDGVWVHNYEQENRNLLPSGSYNQSGIFSGIGQRFINAWNDRGFNTDAQVVQNAYNINGIMGKVDAENQLGYATSIPDANLVKDTYYAFKDPKTGIVSRPALDGIFDTEYGAPLPIKPEMTRGFGVPTKGQNASSEHSGLDIRTINCPDAKCDLRAIADGEVIKVENSKRGSTYSSNPEDYKTGKAQYGHGNFVKIRYSGNIEVTDMHLSNVYVKKGDRVRRGDIIGTTGDTGNSEAPHLHHEVSRNGRLVQPMTTQIK